jgi:hypothetical protein
MSEQARRPEAGDRPALFIEGYLDERFKAGQRPTYGYPKNHLPHAGETRMQVVPSFVGARKAK